MNRALLSFLVVPAFALVACATETSSSPDETGQTAQDLAITPPKEPPLPIRCPAGEKLCPLAEPKGICVERCVPMSVMCIAPKCHPICDPIGAAPRQFCHWDTQACRWDCPVCDPPPPPQQGCKWDTNACVWLCL